MCMCIAIGNERSAKNRDWFGLNELMIERFDCIRDVLFFFWYLFQITLYTSHWMILIMFIDSCRRCPLWSISQSASIVRDARSTAADVWSDSYASYGESSIYILSLPKTWRRMPNVNFIDKYRFSCLDVSANVWARIPSAILSTGISLAILSAVSCDNGVLSHYATCSCKTYHYGTCKYRYVFLWKLVCIEAWRMQAWILCKELYM